MRPPQRYRTIPLSSTVRLKIALRSEWKSEWCVLCDTLVTCPSQAKQTEVNPTVRWWKDGQHSKLWAETYAWFLHWIRICSIYNKTLSILTQRWLQLRLFRSIYCLYLAAECRALPQLRAFTERFFFFAQTPSSRGFHLRTRMVRAERCFPFRLKRPSSLYSTPSIS